MITTTSGTTLGISIGEPTTETVAGFAAKEYIEIGEITNLPSFMGSFSLVQRQPLETGVTKSHKGFFNPGETVIDAALNDEDTGQQTVRALHNGNLKDEHCSLKLTLPSGGIRYATALVMDVSDIIGAANEIIGISFKVQMNSGIIGSGEGDGTPASLNLDFANDAYFLNGDLLNFSDIITFSRPTVRTYHGRVVDEFGGVSYPLLTAAINERCLEYDPATGEPLGLSVFGAATNLVTYSEQFDNAIYTKTGASISANAATAPDLTISMDKLVEDSSTAVHRVFFSATVTDATKYTLSFYAKKLEREYITLPSGVTGGASAGDSTININDGSISGDTASATAEYVGNNTYRISKTYTSTSTTMLPQIQLNNGTSNFYAGDGTSGLYIWGAQLEAGEIATPYIKTEASQETRAADVATVDDLSGWYNQSEGTFFVSNTELNDSAVDKFLFTLADTGGLGIFEASGIIYANSLGGSLISPLAPYSNISALVYSGGEFAISNNGKLSNNQSGYEASQSTIYIGSRNTTQSHIDGHIKQLSYYPAALSESRLKGLTI